MSAEAVKVIVRCRPMNGREKDLNCSEVISMDSSIGQVVLKRPGNEPSAKKTFTFDGAYDTTSTTQQIYEEIAFPLVEGVIEGYNGTIFAYGQTGCGKSYTMSGVVEPTSQRGVIPRAFEHIFDSIGVADETKFLVRGSYLEIYNEEIRDLLGKNPKAKLDLKEHPDKGVYAQGLTQVPVASVREIERAMDHGANFRTVGATLMNIDSSRSHSIFTITLETCTSGANPDGSDQIRAGKLNLVDLAGSERQAKTGAVGQRLKEATKINLSLSALGNVISALVDGKAKHIPYRDSKLTRLLQDSLGGNTKTLMVACISPADNNYDETLSTLRYANRAKNIKNKPKINEDPKDALLRQYQEEIQQLKAMLSGKIPSTGPSTIISEVPSIATEQVDVEDLKRQLREDYESQIAGIRAKYEAERHDRTKLEEEMLTMRSKYEDNLKAVENLPSPLQPTEIPADSTSAERAHHEAMLRLSRINKQMIGGERTDDVQTKERLKKRRRRADERLAQFRRAHDADDDGIMEGIYNSLHDEIKAKNNRIGVVQEKLDVADQEVVDLQYEFEQERRDYLDGIRERDREIQLQRQILDRILPCLRRDCNYTNLDRVRSEARWDDDKGEWALPPLVVVRTTLPPNRLANASSPPSKGAMTLKTQGHDDSFSQRISRASESEYFRSKRATKLLNESASLATSPPGVNFGSGSAGLSLVSRLPPSDFEFGGGGGGGLSRRPRQLESLNPVSGGHAAYIGEDDERVVEKVERKISKQGRKLNPINQKPSGNGF